MLDWSKVLLSSNNSVSPFCFSFLFVYLHLQASFGVKMLKKKKKSQINCILLQQYPGKEIKMKYLTYNQKFLPTLTAEEDETLELLISLADTLRWLTDRCSQLWIYVLHDWLNNNTNVQLFLSQHEPKPLQRRKHKILQSLRDATKSKTN